MRNSKKILPQHNGGYLPPHDANAEQIILGSILIDKNAFMRVSKEFSSEMFYKEPNRLVAESILRLHSQSRKVDLITVFSDLNKHGNGEIIGGLYYLTELTDRVVGTDNLEEHVDLVSKHYLARRQIELYQQKIGELFALQDPEDIAINVSSELISLRKGEEKNFHTMKELAIKAINHRESLGNKKVDRDGLPTGLKELDKAIGGFKAPELTVIAGRPAMGKTAVALAAAKASAVEGTPVAIFSLEMDAEQLYYRFQADEVKINGKKIRRNDLTDTQREHLYFADGNLGELPIFIDDSPSLNIDKLRFKIAYYVYVLGVKKIIVDYLQLLEAETKGFGNNTATVSQISRKLKIYCKEFNVPIIALAQLSRAVESRGATGYKPILADLRESGSIEQDADNVLFLWRPEYYEIDKDIQCNGYNNLFSPKNLLVFIIAKCRGGETRSIPSWIDLSTMTLKDHPDIPDEIDEGNEGEQTELPF
jgi:replicative DNA helicase